jgi:hypothetical protein
MGERMADPVHWSLPLTCAFTLRSVFERRFRLLCKQGVRGSSPLGSTQVRGPFCARKRASSAFVPQKSTATGFIPTLPELATQALESRPGRSRRHLRVDVHRHSDLAVPKDRHRHSRMHVERDQQRGTRPPGRMHRDHRNAGLLRPRLEVAMKVPRVDGVPESRRQDQPRISPRLPGRQPPTSLRHATLLEGLDADVRQWQRSVRGRSFRAPTEQLTLHPLHLPPNMRLLRRCVDVLPRETEQLCVSAEPRSSLSDRLPTRLRMPTTPPTTTRTPAVLSTKSAKSLLSPAQRRPIATLHGAPQRRKVTATSQM